MFSNPASPVRSVLRAREEHRTNNRSPATANPPPLWNSSPIQNGIQKPNGMPLPKITLTADRTNAVPPTRPGPPSPLSQLGPNKISNAKSEPSTSREDRGSKLFPNAVLIDLTDDDPPPSPSLQRQTVLNPQIEYVNDDDLMELPNRSARPTPSSKGKSNTSRTSTLSSSPSSLNNGLPPPSRNLSNRFHPSSPSSLNNGLPPPMPSRSPNPFNPSSTSKPNGTSSSRNESTSTKQTSRSTSGSTSNPLRTAPPVVINLDGAASSSPSPSPQSADDEGSDSRPWEGRIFLVEELMRRHRRQREAAQPASSSTAGAPAPAPAPTPAPRRRSTRAAGNGRKSETEAIAEIEAEINGAFRDLQPEARRNIAGAVYLERSVREEERRAVGRPSTRAIWEEALQTRRQLGSSS